MAVSILKQVMEEKLDAKKVEVAAVKMPAAKEVAPVTAACHYVPGKKLNPQYVQYNKEALDAILARVMPASS